MRSPFLMQSVLFSLGIIEALVEHRKVRSKKLLLKPIRPLIDNAGQHEKLVRRFPRSFLEKSEDAVAKIELPRPSIHS